MRSKSIVLIVDDEPAGRETLEALLTLEPYDLHFAGSGPEALAKAAELIPDIILLDIMLPDIDGYDVCRRLRADPVLANVPILMVTALDDHRSHLRGIEAGADDFIVKPYNRAELRAQIRTILHLNRYRRLINEQARFAWVIDHANDGYLVVDEADQLIYANSQARLYLGLPGDLELARAGSFLDLARKQYLLHSEDAWSNWPELAKEQLPRYLIQSETPTANAVWLEVTSLASPIPPREERLIQLRDVSTQLAAQRDTQTFGAMISHKLAAPINAMYSSLSMLSESISTASPAQVTRLVQIATAGMQRLRSDIDDALEYLAAPTLDHSEMGWPIADLAGLLAEIGRDLALDPIAVSIQDSLKTARLSLHPRAIKFVLWEVLENAMKFHPAHTPRVEVGVTQAGPQAINLRVQDDGITLSPEQLARAWTPFYQGEKVVTGEVPGMGLGLSAVAIRVWSVGGHCRMYNRGDGPGIVVELTLPLL